MPIPAINQAPINWRSPYNTTPPFVDLPAPARTLPVDNPSDFNTGLTRNPLNRNFVLETKPNSLRFDSSIDPVFVEMFNNVFGQHPDYETIKNSPASVLLVPGLIEKEDGSPIRVKSAPSRHVPHSYDVVFQIDPSFVDDVVQNDGFAEQPMFRDANTNEFFGMSIHRAGTHEITHFHQIVTQSYGVPADDNTVEREAWTMYNQNPVYDNNPEYTPVAFEQQLAYEQQTTLREQEATDIADLYNPFGRIRGEAGPSNIYANPTSSYGNLFLSDVWILPDTSSNSPPSYDLDIFGVSPLDPAFGIPEPDPADVLINDAFGSFSSFSSLDSVGYGQSPISAVSPDNGSFNTDHLERFGIPVFDPVVDFIDDAFDFSSYDSLGSFY